MFREYPTEETLGDYRPVVFFVRCPAPDRDNRILCFGADDPADASPQMPCGITGEWKVVLAGADIFIIYII